MLNKNDHLNMIHNKKKTKNDSAQWAFLKWHVKVTELNFSTLQNVFSYGTKR